MHEMSLAEGILQIVEETARSQRRPRVRSVLLELGALSHVEEQALRFCFDAVTRGTVAEGARLDVMRPPGAPGACRAERACRWSAWAMPARSCGSYQLQVTEGEDMRVKEIEVV